MSSGATMPFHFNEGSYENADEYYKAWERVQRNLPTLPYGPAIKEDSIDNLPDLLEDEHIDISRRYKFEKDI